MTFFSHGSFETVLIFKGKEEIEKAACVPNDTCLFVPNSSEKLLKNCSAMFEYAAKVNGTFPKVLVMWGKSAWGNFNLSIFVYLLVLFGEQIIRRFWQAHLWALLTAYLGRLRRGVRIDQVFRTQRCSTELHSTDQLRVPKVYSRTTDFLVKFHFYNSGNPETEKRYISALISCPNISIILHIPRRHLENMEKLIPVLKWSICDIWRHFESKLKRTIVPCTKCCCSMCLWKQ